MRHIPLLLLAIAPAAVLFLFFYLRDRYRKEPLGQLAVTFLLGAIVLLPSFAMSRALQSLTGWSPRTPNLLHALLGALLIVGLVEESWKFLVVRWYAYAQPEFDEPYDGILYSIAAALGFATLENIIYVFYGGFDIGVMRAFLAVPAHAFDGVLMGYFLGEAKFARSERHALWLNFLALATAVLAHGIYDFIVFTLNRRPLMLVNLLVYAALAWVIFFEATRHQAEKSPFRDPLLVQSRTPNRFPD
ncbi:MAG: PrsW family glutamic-type intramembrane protease [candidate division WOR-3 bacterium]